MTTAFGVSVLAAYGAYDLLKKLTGAIKKALRRSKPLVDIDLVPYAMHGLNVRSRLTSKDWKRIASLTYAKSKRGDDLVCMQCGENGFKQGFSHPVECHEVWQFDELTKTQRLAGLLSLCPLCHKAKHIGLADKLGNGIDARDHLMKHNGWTLRQTENYIAEAYRKVRSKQGEYRLDLTYLNRPEFGFLGQEFTSNEARSCAAAMSDRAIAT